MLEYLQDVHQGYITKFFQIKIQITQSEGVLCPFLTLVSDNKSN